MDRCRFVWSRKKRLPQRRRGPLEPENNRGSGEVRGLCFGCSACRDLQLRMKQQARSRREEGAEGEVATARSGGDEGRQTQPRGQTPPVSNHL